MNKVNDVEIPAQSNAKIQTDREDKEPPTKKQSQDDNKQKPQEEQDNFNFFQLFRFANRTDYVLMIVGTISAMVSGATLPTMALLWGDMINNFNTTSGFLELAQTSILLFVYLGLGQFVASALMIGCWAFSGQRQAIQCRKTYLSSLLQQQIGWYDLINQSELSSKFATDTVSFQGAIGEKISTLVYLISLIISGIIISFVKGWLLALVVFVVIPLTAICAFIWMKMIQKQAVKDKEEYTKAGGRAEQAFSSIKTIKMLHGEQYEKGKYKECLEDKQSTIKFGILIGLSFGSLNLSLMLGYALAFWYGSQCIEGNHHCPLELIVNNYTSGQVFTVFLSTIMVGFNFSQVLPSIRKIGQGMEAAKDIYKIIDREPAIKNIENPKTIQNFKGHIKFENVTFAYPKDKNKTILKNINLQFDCKKNALAGESGCGKSTILQLLLRYYDPDEGRITFDGIDLKEIDLHWLRSVIGYVGQEPVLFATSIRQNLLYAKEDATQEQIITALKNAEAYDFITELDDKLDTFVGYGGSQLSGGQKQRIAIARALLKDPAILLLDEATSALDRRNQKLIQATLEKISEKKITITIAHRVKTIMKSDKIFVLKSGDVAEYGKFEELQQFKGIQLEVEEKQEKKAKIETNNEENGFLNLQIEPQELENKPQLTKQELEKKENEQLLEQYADSIVSRTFAYAKEDCCLFIVGTIFAALFGCIYPVFGIFLSKVLFLLFNVQENRQAINLYSLGFLLLGIGSLIFKATEMAIFTYIGEKVTRKIRLEVFAKMLKLPIVWFQKPKNTVGSLTSRLAIDSKQVNEMTTTYVSVIIQMLSTLISGLIIAFVHEWRTAFVALALIPLLAIAGAIRMGFRSGSSTKIEKAYKESSNLITQSMMNIRTVVSFGYDNSIVRQYNKLVQAPKDIALKDSIIGGLLFGFSQFCMYIVVGIVFLIAAAFKQNPDFGDSITIDNIFVAIFAIFYTGMTIGNNSHFLPDLQACKISASRLLSILDTPDEEDLQRQTNSKLIKSGIQGDITFENIKFKYESRKQYLFQNFNLKLKYGDKSAFVGTSGCGKSTIVQLLLRFYDPEEGIIKINGVELNDYDIHYLRECFGVVSQEPVLFNGSFRENIVYNMDTTQEEMRNAATNAHAMSFIEGDEETLKYEKQEEQEEKTGFDRGVGLKGSHISGGQKQRVAIARAILRKPKMLLLDEATSALDNVNEKKVQECLDEIMKDKTTITIAHRMETIKNSDIIHVFERGTIVESGNFTELISKRGYFYNLEKGTQFV